MFMGLAMKIDMGLTLAAVTLPFVAIWIIGLAMLGVPREEFPKPDAED